MAPGASSSRLDVYRKVTETIIEQIEAGAGEYRMPWHHDGSAVSRPRNAVAPAFYRGINVLSLWAAAHRAGYTSGLWATYRQWQLVQAQVREREKGTLVVFWKQLDHPIQAYTEDAPEDDEQPKHRFVARGYWVFNVAQVDGYIPFDLPVLSEDERHARAEAFYANLNFETRFGGDEAFYLTSGDYIQMPLFAHFRDAGAYYGTLFHEAAHATGASARLNRDLSGRFGSEAYAMEEMIAEWSSAMACASLDLTPEPRFDHALYIDSWLTVLRRDRQAAFHAARQAQIIVDWMWANQHN